VEAKAEGVAGRVGIHPPVSVLAELVSALEHRRAETEYSVLVRLDVVYIEVEVYLLGTVLPRPARRAVVVDALECERCASEPDHFDPVRVLYDHPPAEQFGVERCETHRVRAVQRYRLELLDHPNHPPLSCFGSACDLPRRYDHAATPALIINQMGRAFRCRPPNMFSGDRQVAWLRAEKCRSALGPWRRRSSFWRGVLFRFATRERRFGVLV